MNATSLESQIAAALSGRGTSLDRSRDRSEASQKDNRSTWAADYGARSETTARAAVESARLCNDGGSDSDGASGPVRKSRLDNGGSWSGKALWREMIAALCPGTRNLFIGFGVLAFIVVV